MTADATRPRRPTAHDVAERAGVSRATVSHVLNGRGSRFPEETRARVRAAAEELRYRPSPAGRALVTGRSDVVVLYIPNTTFGGNLQDLVDEVDVAARRSGFTVIVRFAGRDVEETLTAFVDLAPAAVIDLAALSGSDREVLESAGITVLPRIASGADLEGADRFDVEIGRRAAQELLRTGQRVLVYAALADARSDPYGPARYQGMIEVAHDAGMQTPARIEVPLDGSGAAAALRPIVSSLPVGIGCYNDAVAIAVLAGARQLDLSVPAQMSVVGVDATDLGQLVAPRLTTLRIDLHAVVARIVQDVSALRTSDEPEAGPGTAPLISVVPGEST